MHQRSGKTEDCCERMMQKSPIKEGVASTCNLLINSRAHPHAGCPVCHRHTGSGYAPMHLLDRCSWQPMLLIAAGQAAERLATTGVSLTKSRDGYSSNTLSDVVSADYTGPAAQLRYWGFAHVVFSGGCGYRRESRKPGGDSGISLSMTSDSQLAFPHVPLKNPKDTNTLALF